MLDMQDEKSGASLSGVGAPATEHPPRPRAAASDEVRRLLVAGLEEIRDKGTVNPRVADIVRRAGLSNKAFYRHFRSKDDLLIAILDAGMRERVRTFERRLSQSASAAERVRIWIRGVLEQALIPEFADATRPLLLYQGFITKELGEQLWAHRDYLRAPLERALEQGRRNGEFGDVDPRRDAEVIYFLAMGWMHGKVIERTIPSEEEAENLIEFALRAILST